MFNSETWVDHPLDKNVQMSDFGRCRRLVRTKNRIPGTQYFRNDDGAVYKLVEPKTRDDGRKVLTVGAKRAQVAWHVLRAFVGAPSKGQVASHVAVNDRLNNHLSNLRWCSKSEDMFHRKLHGTSGGSPKRGRRLTLADAHEIRKLYANGMTQVEIAERYGCTSMNISYIVRGKQLSEGMLKAKSVTESHRKQARKLDSEGKTIAQIGLLMNTSESCVRYEMLGRRTQTSLHATRYAKGKLNGATARRTA